MSGLTVDPSGLQGGSKDVAQLQAQCQFIAEYLVATLRGMAGTAGHAGLTSALNGTAAKGNRGFSGAWAAYGKAGAGLAGSAATYSATEQAIIDKLTGVTPGTFFGGPTP
jgi:hypothetical protein